MKIARVVLEFPKGASVFRKNRNPKKAKGSQNLVKKKSKKSRMAVFLQHLLMEYHSNPLAYRQRIKGVLNSALEQGPDVICLPACAIIYRSPAERRAYFADVPSNVVIAAGAYSCSDKHEHILVWRDHGFLTTPDYGPYAFDLGEFRAAFAISSSVRYLVDYPDKCIGWPLPPKKTPLVIVDMGHQQYTSRYQTFTLPRIQGNAAPGTNAFLVLSWWRFLGGNPKARWAVPDDTTFEQHKRGDRDWLDLFQLA